MTSPDLSTSAAPAANDLPMWHRSLGEMTEYLDDVESRGQAINFRPSIEAAMAEARRDNKPVLFQVSCFQHGRRGAPHY